MSSFHPRRGCGAVSKAESERARERERERERALFPYLSLIPLPYFISYPTGQGIFYHKPSSSSRPPLFFPRFEYRVVFVIVVISCCFLFFSFFFFFFCPSHSIPLSLLSSFPLFFLFQPSRFLVARKSFRRVTSRRVTTFSSSLLFLRRLLVDRGTDVSHNPHPSRPSNFPPSALLWNSRSPCHQFLWPLFHPRVRGRRLNARVENAV